MAIDIRLLLMSILNFDKNFTQYRLLAYLSGNKTWVLEEEDAQDEIKQGARRLFDLRFAS